MFTGSIHTLKVSRLIFLSLVLVIGLAACAPAGGVPVAGASAGLAQAPVSPTSIPATATPQPAASPTATEAPTPTPTATPAPSPTPTVPPPLRLVAGQSAYVRSGPGKEYDPIGQLSAGQSFLVTGVNPARDWLQFDYNGQTGWVLAGLVKVDGDTATVAVAQHIPAPPPPAPDRIVAPTIKVDSKVVPVRWHTVKTANGETTEWDVAAYAVGWHFNSARPGQAGNTVMSGHNNIDGEVFRYLSSAKVGDPITIYAGGKAYHYTVTDTMILPDKYVSAEQRLQNARWIEQFPDERLTLVSCWPYNNNTHRVIVVAKPAS